MIEMDPRWEWIEVTWFGDSGVTYVRGQCNHLEAVPVEGSPAFEYVFDEDGARPIVAHLCLTCDRQLPAEWRP